ncbi:MAG: gliding motility-associated-like protein [Bacteroidia bacterium]|jgi:gliding motility-associated-like protein
MLRLKFIWILVLALSPLSLFATHIVGGEVFYTHLGGDQYSVILLVYRDCDGGQADLDDPAPLGIYNTTTNALIQTVDMDLDSVVQIITEINSSCVTSPNDICVEVGYYTEIVTLDQILAGGYTLTYQRCCRNGITQNILTPDDIGATYTTTVPGTNSSPNNSSPFFLNLPPNYICAGLPFTFNHVAIDPDGDSLVYELCTPYEGGTSANPAPDPPGAPPYVELGWGAGFSTADMLGGGSALSMDPVTGVITATPGAEGNFVIGLCVSEYRNGVLLSQTRRDYQINVVDCEAPIAEPFDTNAQPGFPFVNCEATVDFEAINTAGFSILWDFGDLTTTADNSTGANPSWTYPGPGDYDLTLIVFNPINPNDPLCADTVIQTVTVQDTVLPDAGPDALICEGDSIQIGPSPAPGSTYSWTPVDGLSDPSVAQPMAFPNVITTYTVVETDSVGCSGFDEVMVTFMPNPTITVSNDTSVCPNTDAQLSAAGGVSYEWSPPATLNNPNIFNPIATPIETTTYYVLVTDVNGCEAMDSVTITMFEVAAWSDTSICMGDAAQLGVEGGVSWVWTPPGDLNDPTAQNPIATPTVTTTYFVSVTASTGCVAEDSITVTIADPPTAFAGFDHGVCSGQTIQLGATGGVTYSWEPPTGLNDPNIANPILTLSGDSATLIVTVTDPAGCTDTDTVTVWAEPLPDALAGPNSTICIGESVNLFATGGEFYSWDPASGLDNPSIANPLATPGVTTTYTVTVGQPTGNLVANGDFSFGNVGFLSDYGYSTNLNPEGLYSIVTDPSTVHGAFVGSDHTGNAPLDSFMVVNGAGTPGLNVWCQTVSVSPNTNYSFGTWVSTMVTGSPAILQFSINGVILGSPFTAPNVLNQWNQFAEDWFSGTATSATICIVNQNTTTGGNDFGIDDISFSTVCTSTAEVTITVNELPEANAGDDTEFCIGQGVQLNASGGVSYSWTPPLGLNDPNISDPLANPVTTTVYTVTVADAIGCENTDQIVVTLHPQLPASAGPDLQVCFGDDIVLQGSGGITFSWDPPTYLDNSNEQLPISTPDQDISYTVTVTDVHGCVASDDMNVTVMASPIVGAGQDSVICLDGSLVLQATGGTSYTWFPVDGLSDPNIGNPNASPFGDILYTVIGTDNNGCSNIDSVFISYFRASAAPDSIVCNGDSVQAFVSGGATFQWSPVDGVSDPNSSSPFLSPDVSTIYTVTATSNAGCDAIAEVSIDILSLPVSSFEVDMEPSCDGIFADFNNMSTGSDNYLWLFGDGDTSIDFSPEHVYPPGAGSVITLIAYNNEGFCIDTMVLDLTDQWYGNDTIDITNSSAFTPNYDGLNDCFRPAFDGHFSDCYELRVFSRWGILQFESVAGQNHCWDGRNKSGEMATQGTYYYIVNLNGIEQHGYVTLIE